MAKTGAANRSNFFPPPVESAQWPLRARLLLSVQLVSLMLRGPACSSPGGLAEPSLSALHSRERCWEPGVGTLAEGGCPFQRRQRRSCAWGHEPRAGRGQRAGQASKGGLLMGLLEPPTSFFLHWDSEVNNTHTKTRAIMRRGEGGSPKFRAVKRRVKLRENNQGIGVACEAT